MPTDWRNYPNPLYDTNFSGRTDKTKHDGNSDEGPVGQDKHGARAVDV